MPSGEHAAVLRAIGHRLADAALRNPDGLAERLLSPGPGLAGMMKVPGGRRVARRRLERRLPGGVWFELARTRWMDDVVAERVGEGVAQVVLVGAGLDSRAHRMAGVLDRAAVFEVDHPAALAHKRERVRAALGARARDVVYVGAIPGRDDLGGALSVAGYDHTAPAVVLWAGGSPYLPPDEVRRVLAWGGRQAAGSLVAFDYVWQELVDGELDIVPGARALRQWTRDNGAALRWGVPLGQTAAVVRSVGLELVEEVDGEAAAARYLERPDGTRVGWMWPFAGFALARATGAVRR